MAPDGIDQGLCSSSAPSYPRWTAVDLALWQLVPDRLGGGRRYLFAYKDAWIRFNARHIKAAARNAAIPPKLLAGVAWLEIGGMPDFVDDIAFPVRSFDWSGPDWVDRNLTITKNPGLTSMGAVSIQLVV